MSYCVMVKGKCRGNNCDFWARIRIRKRSDSELISDMIVQIENCERGPYQDIEGALEQYWKDFGIRNMMLLCREEPDLCERIRHVEQLVARQIR